MMLLWQQQQKHWELHKTTSIVHYNRCCTEYNKNLSDSFFLCDCILLLLLHHIYNKWSSSNPALSVVDSTDTCTTMPPFKKIIKNLCMIDSDFILSGTDWKNKIMKKSRWNELPLPGGGSHSRDRVRSSATQDVLRVEALLLHIESSQLSWFRPLIWIPPGRLPLEVYEAQSAKLKK